MYRWLPPDGGTILKWDRGCVWNMAENMDINRYIYVVSEYIYIYIIERERVQHNISPGIDMESSFNPC